MSSRRWPSKPAATTIASGRKARTAGSIALLERLERVRVAGSRQQRDVERRALAGAGAGLLGVAGAGEAEGRVLVQAHVEDVRVGLERVLDAVAVVGVEVEDEHPAAPVRLLPVARRDDGVVEEAEAERPRALGVVPGGAHRAEGERRAAGLDQVDRGRAGAGGEQGRLVGGLADLVVAVIEPLAPGERRLLEAQQVLLVVRGEQGLPAGGARVAPRSARRPSAPARSRPHTAVTRSRVSGCPPHVACSRVRSSLIRMNCRVVMRTTRR